jgi:EpsD family peptidyl-prolyl cis-trans isomerase
MKKLTFTLTPTLLVTALCLALTACGNKDEKKAATQVAAKVGSEEISVHQINQVLSQNNARSDNPEALKAQAREVLEKLIDQQLAVDKATENKLHRSPEVVAQLEAAKRDVLARAYIKQISNGVSKPTPEEQKKYYNENPALFSERRIFGMQEVLMPNSPEIIETIRAFAQNSKSAEEVVGYLKSKGIKFGGGNATKAAEQIPLEILPKIHAMKDGQSIVIENPKAITFLHLVNSQSSPVTEAAALPRIEQFMTNQRAGEAIAANLKSLRSKAEITYMGDFAKSAEGTTPAAAATPAPTTPATPDAAPGKASVIEKGAAGL